jgi:hypothetical protein|tara:strand:- start:16038 stop:16427 length:390 start_codon:yes stop_codon:yes gene_type:complete
MGATPPAIEVTKTVWGMEYSAHGARATREEDARGAANARRGILETVARTTRTTRARETGERRGLTTTNAARSRDAACPKRHKMEAEAMFPGVDVGDMLVVPTRQVRGRTTTRARRRRARRRRLTMDHAW